MPAINNKMSVMVVLFDGFELLDVFGPLEMFGMLPELFEINLVAEKKGLVRSAQGTNIMAPESIYSAPSNDILFIPGGLGTREAVNNAPLIEAICKHARSSEFVLTVCTGAALLARTGLLDGIKATSNKRAFSWVMGQGTGVNWIPKARWVDDGKFHTSSGISAGIDMTLAFIAKIHGKKTSLDIANKAEYEWHQDPSWDPFSITADTR
jgi:transcriptional regulator GlxA family with amidase domain